MLILQVQSHGSLPAFLFVRNRRPLLMEGRRGLFHILISVCRYSAAILAFLMPMLPSPNRYTPVMLLLVAQMFLSLASRAAEDPSIQYPVLLHRSHHVCLHLLLQDHL